MDKKSKLIDPIPLAIVTITGALLIYGTLDMPPYGDPTAPSHHHVGQYYINKSEQQVGPPNMVTSVLASYRGYDTLGEVTVIFTAAAGVMALIGRSRRRKKRVEKA
jgi:multicomponent Na+:H+ antiporter subunit B